MGGIDFQFVVVSSCLCFLSSLQLTLATSAVPEEVDFSNGSDWYDCSAELKIVPKITFANVYSDPNVVTKGSGQIIYKTLTYNPGEENFSTPVDAPQSIGSIKAVLTQMYFLWGKHWVTFLQTPPLDECAEHSGTVVDPDGKPDGPLCPLVENTPTDIFTIHPPLNPLTPYGLYRSRQVYRDANTGELIGCVDMRFWYCETDEVDAEGGRCRKGGQTRQAEYRLRRAE